MNKRLAAPLLAGVLAAPWAIPAGAQQPPAPSFAPSNTTAAGIRSMAANCAMCHGTGGRAATGSPVASLAGKSRDDIAQTMAQFKSGQKPATIMHQIAKGYTDEEIAALAAYFAAQPR